MTDDELLISHARDLKNQAYDSMMITSTGFLDLRQISLLSSLERELSNSVDTFYYGGCENCERKAAVFSPKLFGVIDICEHFKECEDDSPIRLIRIDKDRFSSLCHRDYLGSLMSLGIKRETLGDIVVDDGGSFVFCMAGVSEYIVQNLTTVSKGSVKVRLCRLSEYEPTEQRFQFFSCFVASMRLDNAVSACFGLSRNKSVQIIEQGLVYVNAVQSEKIDMKLSQKTKLVVRGRGKCEIEQITGQSKKGRLCLKIKKYI